MQPALSAAVRNLFTGQRFVILYSKWDIRERADVLGSVPGPWRARSRALQIPIHDVGSVYIQRTRMETIANHGPTQVWALGCESRGPHSRGLVTQMSAERPPPWVKAAPRSCSHLGESRLVPWCRPHPCVVTPTKTLLPPPLTLESEKVPKSRDETYKLSLMLFCIRISWRLLSNLIFSSRLLNSSSKCFDTERFPGVPGGPTLATLQAALPSAPPGPGAAWGPTGQHCRLSQTPSCKFKSIHFTTLIE